MADLCASLSCSFAYLSLCRFYPTKEAMESIGSDRRQGVVWASVRVESPFTREKTLSVVFGEIWGTPRPNAELIEGMDPYSHARPGREKASIYGFEGTRVLSLF